MKQNRRKSANPHTRAFFVVGKRCGQTEYLRRFPDMQFERKAQEREKETCQALVVQQEAANVVITVNFCT